MRDSISMTPHPQLNFRCYPIVIVVLRSAPTSTGKIPLKVISKRDKPKQFTRRTSQPVTGEKYDGGIAVCRKHS